jgi:hypothetical protein
LNYGTNQVEAETKATSLDSIFEDNNNSNIKRIKFILNYEKYPELSGETSELNFISTLGAEKLEKSIKVKFLKPIVYKIEHSLPTVRVDKITNRGLVRFKFD